MTTHGPFDPNDLVRWAEMYGHPEEWAKRAQASHARAEAAEAERDRYRKVIEQIVSGRQLGALDFKDHALSLAYEEVRSAL